MTSAPNSSQGSLQTITLWRWCSGCHRDAPMRRIAGDTLWQCLWCGYHDQEPVQTSAQSATKEAST